MRRPWPALLLLLGGALLLVSPYLPWQRASLDTSEFDGTTEELLHLFGGMNSWDGWYSGVAPASALATLVSLGLAAAALVRPWLREHLPIGRTALVAAYFGLAVAVEGRARVGFVAGQGTNVDYHFAYGAYLGMAGAIALLLGAGFLRRREISASRSPLTAIGAALVLGLLLAFLLPWYGFVGDSQPGISMPAAQLAAAVAIWIPAWRRLRERVSAERLGQALFVGVLTVGALASITFPGEREYGPWVGLAFAIALVTLSLLGGISVPDVPRMPWSRLVLGAVAALFVAALFLPTMEFCYPAGALGSSSAAGCDSQKAWLTFSGSAAGALAMALIAHALLPKRRWFSPLELTAGIGLLVTTFGFQFSEGEFVHLRYGFWIAAGCAVVLVAVAFARARTELDARLVPLAVCLVYLAVVVPPWWSVVDLPGRVRWAFWFAPFSWLTIAGALLCLTLMRLWLERREAVVWFVLIPMAMATLAVVDLARAEAVTWGGGIVLGLCGVLALIGRLEQSPGMRIAVPEILRIDRL